MVLRLSLDVSVIGDTAAWCYCLYPVSVFVSASVCITVAIAIVFPSPLLTNTINHHYQQQLMLSTIAVACCH